MPSLFSPHLPQQVAVLAAQKVLLQRAVVQQLVHEHAARGAHADEQHDVGVVQAAQDGGLLQELLLTLGVCVCAYACSLRHTRVCV